MKQWIFKSQHPTFYPVCFSVTISSALVWSNQMVSHKMLDMNISYGLETVFPHSSVVKCVDLRLFTTWDTFWPGATTQAKDSWALLSSHNVGNRGCFGLLEKWSWNFPLKGKKKTIVQTTIFQLSCTSYIFVDISGKSEALNQCNFWSIESAAKLISNLWASKHFVFIQSWFYFSLSHF